METRKFAPQRGTENKEFLKRLLSTFKNEADEHLQNIYTSLGTLSNALKEGDLSHTQEGIEVIFREAHSLKGAARAVNLGPIEQFCQIMESNLSSVKKKAIPLSADWIELLTSAADLLKDLLQLLDSPPEMEKMKASGSSLIRRLEEVPQGESKQTPVTELKPVRSVESRPQPAREPLGPEVPKSADTIRVPLTKLDSLFTQIQEMLPIKLESNQIVSELRELESSIADRRRTSRADHRETGIFLDRLHSRFLLLERLAERNQRSLTSMLDQLQKDAKTLLLLPFSTITEILPRIARDLCRAQNKKIEFSIQGEELEIDKRILDELKDPMIHLIRNCIDHGIEKPEIRLKKGKAAQGSIHIGISQREAGKVEIVIKDDGGGIDSVDVQAAAVKSGFSQQKIASLGEKGVLNLIFQSGLSTSPIITDISGRGLGLAIVREKVEKLDGSVSVESQKDLGTTFKLVLPLTLSTFRGLVVRIGENEFVLSTINVVQAIQVRKEEIRTLENRESIVFREQVLSVVDLADVLEITRTPLARIGAASSREVALVILSYNHVQIAFKVDAILVVEEVMVKSLGPQLSKVRNIAGCAILRARELVPIISVPDLMKSAISARPVGSYPQAVVERELKSVLVVEDSITSRTLLKNLFETAGYNVTTAIDGVDALDKLHSFKFDAVVTDVEMPRMNGFNLTKSIRGEQSLHDLPVILVTGLDSDADRERGIEVGANAYIVKRGFERDNLIETLRRFI